MTLKNIRAPLLCCLKLCASFHSHQWILTGVTVQKRPIWVKIANFLSLNCDLHNVKLCASLQSHEWIQTGVTVRKCSIRVKIGDFLFRVTSKFDTWPWKTIGHLFYATLSFVHHFKAIGEFKLKCDLAIWLITLKNKRAHFLCHFKLCASFRSHWIYHLETPNLGQNGLGPSFTEISLSLW